MDALIQPVVKPLEDIYKKAPALPAGGREFLVKIAPWLALIGGALSVFVGGMGILGAGLLALPYAAVPQTGALTMWTWIAVIFLLVQGVILLLAFPGLKKRLLKGWNLLFLAEVLWIVSDVVKVVFTMNVLSLVWTVVIAAIAFYLLFQVKPSYK